MMSEPSYKGELARQQEAEIAALRQRIAELEGGQRVTGVEPTPEYVAALLRLKDTEIQELSERLAIVEGLTMSELEAEDDLRERVSQGRSEAFTNGMLTAGVMAAILLVIVTVVSAVLGGVR